MNRTAVISACTKRVWQRAREKNVLHYITGVHYNNSVYVLPRIEDSSYNEPTTQCTHRACKTTRL